MPKEELNRVWILRKVLNPLSPVETMELLLDKLSKTRATPNSRRNERLVQNSPKICDPGFMQSARLLLCSLWLAEPLCRSRTVARSSHPERPIPH